MGRHPRAGVTPRPARVQLTIRPILPTRTRARSGRTASQNARYSARSDWQFGKESGLGQVIVHKQDGVIETEFTYGDDPRETPG